MPPLCQWTTQLSFGAQTSHRHLIVKGWGYLGHNKVVRTYNKELKRNESTIFPTRWTNHHLYHCCPLLQTGFFPGHRTPVLKPKKPSANPSERVILFPNSKPVHEHSMRDSQGKPNWVHLFFIHILVHSTNCNKQPWRSNPILRCLGLKTIAVSFFTQETFPVRNQTLSISHRYVYNVICICDNIIGCMKQHN